MLGDNRRAGLGSGEEGADMLTLEVEDVSEGTRSMSFSKGLSSSKVSICDCTSRSVGELSSYESRLTKWCLYNVVVVVLGYHRHLGAAYGAFPYLVLRTYTLTQIHGIHPAAAVKSPPPPLPPPPSRSESPCPAVTQKARQFAPHASYPPSARAP